MSEELVKVESGVIAIDQPEQVMKFGKDLAKYIKKNHLSVRIKDKDYVEVEGWQYAGAMLGLTAIPDSLEDRSTDRECKYRASVKIVRMSDGVQVGAGFAVCSNKEAKKRSFDEYAVASMAQTRATGKAYRLLLGWMVKAAGYESVPAEEMPDTRFKEHHAPAARPEDYPLPESWVASGWPKTLGACHKKQLSDLITYCDENNTEPELAEAARQLAIPKSA